MVLGNVVLGNGVRQVGFAARWVGLLDQVSCFRAWGVTFGGWGVVWGLGGGGLGLREVVLG